MTKDQLIKSLAKSFSDFGIPYEAAERAVQREARPLLTVYDKFNNWAYSTDQQVDTKFSIGDVKKCGGGLVSAQVYLSGGNVRVLAANVLCEEGA